ncbi:hypothetical protein GCM10017786_02050 [Amycolatopsis deserti]|uniref:Uncharacterized protein n=1 Tax=Amycolatopsis deserti TaxID=185696 RepID=A0ABQ3ID70_9PSEU|nr:hypothetical protein [Amycolatopsis deserti]GHE76561.1 hypothetical protein GCM10017786_02050 [Amycolatopsis deserti]
MNQRDHNAEPAEGGDPACWLARVCPDCGLVADVDPPTVCRRCGARLEGEDFLSGR